MGLDSLRRDTQEAIEGRACFLRLMTYKDKHLPWQLILNVKVIATRQELLL